MGLPWCVTFDIRIVGIANLADVIDRNSKEEDGEEEGENNQKKKQGIRETARERDIQHKKHLTVNVVNYSLHFATQSYL